VSITRHRIVTLHRGPRKDPVTAQVAAQVIERDIRIAGGCVPKYLGAPGDCRDRWGIIVRPDAREALIPYGDAWPHGALTLGHLREHSGGMRRSEPRWLFAGCWGHGVQSWELSHVDELRAYLARVAA